MFFEISFIFNTNFSRGEITLYVNEGRGELCGLLKLASTNEKLHENEFETAGIMTKRSVVSALKTNEI